MTIVEKINHEIKEAMKAKAQLRLEVLRMLKSKILAKDARANLTDQEVIQLFKTYHSNLVEAKEQATALHRTETAEKLAQELLVVEEFLPKAPSLEETRKIVEEAIRLVEAKSKKEMGLVMKKVIEIEPNIDRKIASQSITEQLP